MPVAIFFLFMLFAAAGYGFGGSYLGYATRAGVDFLDMSIFAAFMVWGASFNVGAVIIAIAAMGG